VIRALLILVAVAAAVIAVAALSGWLDDRAPAGSRGRAPVSATDR
jgi:hypothetical protein